jgi:uncharacterized membrane-anchored protein YitT (DUF2179 family)
VSRASRPPLAALRDAPATPHSRLDDAVAMLVGTFVASLGLYLLHLSGAVTGGTAGLALLLGYALHLPFGPVFLVINLPFLALAAWKRGWSFALRTLLAVALVSAWAYLHPLVADVVAIAPVYGTLTGNLLAGLGMLILFRHNASLGGLNTLALLAQDLLGLRAGLVQLCFDALIVALSLSVAPPPTVLLSAIGAAVLNLVLVMNHRPGRYVGG